jgi:DNA-binding XRE family transcriptional regulator
MDSLLVDVAIVAEPPDCSRPYFEFMAFIKSHQCVRVFWVHRQTPETLPVSKIRNYLPRPYGYLPRVGHFCNFLPQGVPQTNVGYNPLVYNHQAAKLKSIMPLRRQVQPKSGPEKAFGIVLREIREAAGLSQMDVYKHCGIDRTYLSAIERGIQSPTLRMIVRLSNAFGIAPSALIKRMERSRFYRV